MFFVFVVSTQSMYNKNLHFTVTMTKTELWVFLCFCTSRAFSTSFILICNMHITNHYKLVLVHFKRYVFIQFCYETIISYARLINN